jgi:CheY-like chemotaxis protein
MKITVIGRGNVGGGLARLWERAGHEVTALGREGGDASGSDVVVVAVPSGAIDEALGRVRGLAGKPAIDATNAYGGRAAGFESLAHQVKARTQGPVAKAFNVTFAALYNQIGQQRATPSCLYAADDAARAVAEWRPDLVVLDPSVPGLDGVGLARRLRADPAAAGVPLVALTKLAGGALLAAGCDALVAVASDAEGLLRALRHGGGAEAAGAPRPDPRAPTGARPWPTGSPASGGGPRRRAPPWPP